MITLLGTSHVSPESLERLEEEMERRDCLAVELDPIRYQALMSGEGRKPPWILPRILYHIQQRIGRATGVAPGEDMLRALELAGEMGIPSYLIDRDARVTMGRIQDAPLREKVSIFSPFVLWGRGFDVSQVPPEELIGEALAELEDRAPTIYEALVTERNRHMAEGIESLEEEYGNVLVVVGAGHVRGLEKILKSREMEVEVA